MVRRIVSFVDTFYGVVVAMIVNHIDSVADVGSVDTVVVAWIVIGIGFVVVTFGTTTTIPQSMA